MIIEFLFSNYKKQILKSSFPLFVAQCVTFFLQIQANESAHYDMRHKLPNQLTYLEFKKTLPPTVWNWSEEQTREFSDVSK